MSLAPIVLFAYNRPEHLRLVVEALAKNEEAAASDLFVYSDAPKDALNRDRVAETRLYIKGIKGFGSVTVVERDENWGLANNIIDGVTSVVNKYGKLIVLEDDLITSPYFLRFMNEALDLYEAEEDVVSIHGYIYPMKKHLPETFFIKGADCWGWATWKRGWDLFNPNGEELWRELQEKKLTKAFDFNHSYPYCKMLRRQIRAENNSWAIRWYASAFLKNKLTLYPGRSLVNQIGVDGSGTHSVLSDAIYQTALSPCPVQVDKLVVEESVVARQHLIHFLRYTRRMSKLICRLKGWIRKWNGETINL